MKTYRIEIERIIVETLVFDVPAENAACANEVRDNLTAQFNSDPHTSLGNRPDGTVTYFQALSKATELKQ